MLRIRGGKHAVEELEGIQWIGAGGDAVVLHVNKALGGGPSVEAAFEGSTDGSDFGFCARLFGGDNRETGIPGAEVGG